jgi:hypothetical protein
MTDADKDLLYRVASTRLCVSLFGLASMSRIEKASSSLAEARGISLGKNK